MGLPLPLMTEFRSANTKHIKAQGLRVLGPPSAEK